MTKTFSDSFIFLDLFEDDGQNYSSLVYPDPLYLEPFDGLKVCIVS